jgi:hypothetical protein
MAAEKPLLQRELEDSSSDDDDYLIKATTAIVETYSNKKGRYGCSVPDHKVIIEIEKAGTKGCFKITLLMS